MIPVTIKLENNFLQTIERTRKKHNYMTKTEFIRQAIRDKIKELEKEETLKNVEKIFGASKHKTTDEDLHRARERAVEKLEKKFKSRQVL